MPRSDFPGPESVFAAAIGVWLLIMLAVLVITVVIWWKIFQKAGYSGALALLMLIPLANFVVMLVLAFSEWPIEREVRLLRAAANRPPITPAAPSAPPPQFPQQP